jgi:hypothetical protein
MWKEEVFAQFEVLYLPVATEDNHDSQLSSTVSRTKLESWFFRLKVKRKAIPVTGLKGP